MKKSELLINAIGEIEDKFIEESEIVRQRVPWAQIATIAACVCLVVGVVVMLPKISEKNIANDYDSAIEETDNDGADDSLANGGGSILEDAATDQEEPTTNSNSSISESAPTLSTSLINMCDNIFTAEIISATEQEDMISYTVKVEDVLYSQSDISENITVFDYIGSYDFEPNKKYLISTSGGLNISDTLTALIEEDGRLVPVYPTSKTVLADIETIEELCETEEFKELTEK